MARRKYKVGQHVCSTYPVNEKLGYVVSYTHIQNRWDKKQDKHIYAVRYTDGTESDWNEWWEIRPAQEKEIVEGRRLEWKWV